MTEKTDRDPRGDARDCGVEGWIAFGTLLGAARNGAGHRPRLRRRPVLPRARPDPARAWPRTCGGSAARCARAGMRVEHKSGELHHRELPRPRRRIPASIDVYSTFYLDDLFYETATVRGPGAARGAAAAATPSSSRDGCSPHRPTRPRCSRCPTGPAGGSPTRRSAPCPGPEIVDRFDGWFGSLMRSRRDWNHVNCSRPRAAPRARPSSPAGWLEQLEPDVRRGRGRCRRRGRPAPVRRAGPQVLGLDYALPRPGASGVPRRIRRERPRAQPRTTSATSSLAVRCWPGTRVARRSSHDSSSRRSTRRRGELLAARGDGDAPRRPCLPGRASPRPRHRSPSSPSARRAGACTPSPRRSLDRHIRKAGARIVDGTGLDAADRATRGAPTARWRMVVEWPEATDAGPRQEPMEEDEPDD